MTPRPSRISIARSVLELLGIVFLRFRPAQRLWGAWLVAVNAASALFLQHVEARVALAAVGVALVAQAVIYQRRRFIRLLGVTHALWVPMLAWIALRLGELPADGSAFRAWLLVLTATNSASLAIDAWDATRYLRGERAPHYAW
jgi:hypothetical protein